MFNQGGPCLCQIKGSCIRRHASVLLLAHAAATVEVLEFPISAISTMRTGKNIFQGRLTIGLDLGDRSSASCVLNEAGEIVTNCQPRPKP
jgi:hypothetical protein